MKVVIYFITTFVVANAVLEENKILVGELSKIERENSACVHGKPKDEQCCYKRALAKLNYDQTAATETTSYRNFCKQNTTTIVDDCKKSEEFVYCLHREVQNEINRIRDKCVEKYGADLQAMRTENPENLIKQQSFACFMFCFQKNTGVMNDDLSINFDDAESKNATIVGMMEECTKVSDVEKTKCSKAARLYYCLSEKMSGY